MGTRQLIARGLWLCAAAMAALALAACGTAGKYPAAPTSATGSDYTYVIGPLDTVNIIVWRNADWAGTVPVRPDGRIPAPLVDALQAAGHHPQELAREIEKTLPKYIRDPVVTVVVNNFQGQYGEQIRIVGEAAKPQSLPYRKDMSLLDVMIQVGGLTDFADGNGAVLVRGSEGGKQYSIRLRDLLKRGDISANVQVRPGDVIIVPQSWF